MRPPQCGHREANIQSAICFTVFLSAECTEMISEHQQPADLTTGVFLRPCRPCCIAAIFASYHGNGINRRRVFDIRHCIIRRSITAQSCVQPVSINQSHCLHLRTSALHNSGRWDKSFRRAIYTRGALPHRRSSSSHSNSRCSSNAGLPIQRVPSARRRRLGCE